MKPRDKRLIRREWNRYKVSIIFLIYVFSMGFGSFYLYNYQLIKGITFMLPAIVTAVLIFKRKIE